ncbi:hypothetical protein HOH45_04400 [bacterium]|jgi:2-oxoglutarate/2-oxoacid ferredoxin oxidoreductase subunit alpha|nr:hypothetical protein [bacterium]
MEKKDIRLELLMDAGNGAQSAASMLINEFAKEGKYVFIEPMIPAEISPPKRTPHSMSGAIVRTSNFEISCIGSSSDLMLVEHEILIDRRLNDKEYTKDTIILLDAGDERRNKDGYQAVYNRMDKLGLTYVAFNLPDVCKSIMLQLKGRGKNMVYLGMLTAIFNSNYDKMYHFVKTSYKKLSPEKQDLNCELYKEGYKFAQSEIDVRYSIESKRDDSKKVFMDGNMAISFGAIDSGIKLFAGYPITPASSIMHELAKIFPSYGGIVHQAEDEISAMGTVVGSYFSGVPAMTATSGPGLSLKQEIIGLAMASEIPAIIVNVQRGGPSTGLPTKTEQSDLQACLYGCHGDNTKVILSVADVEDCFYAPHVARYLGEKLRVPVIILSDYATSVSFKVIGEPTQNKLENIDDINDDILERFFLTRFKEEIPMVKNNQSIPGEQGKERRVTGLSTDGDGRVDFSSDAAIDAHNIRNQKMHILKESLQKPEIFGQEEADLLIVGWGSARGVIKETIDKCKENKLSVSGLHFKIVNPLPLGLKELLSKFKRVMTVEVAYGDRYKSAPFARELRNETLVDVESGVCEPSGRPLKPDVIMTKIREVLS